VRRANDKTIEELTLLAADYLRDANWHEARVETASQRIREWMQKKQVSEQQVAALRAEYGRCLDEIRKKEGDVNSIGSK
jgi:uncharacterized protein (DUF2235 family)